MAGEKKPRRPDHPHLQLLNESLPFAKSTTCAQLLVMQSLSLLCLLVAIPALSAAIGTKNSTPIFIVAGQSNMLNWHASAASLPPDTVDWDILFYHVTGAPPNRGFDMPINASSAGKWVQLGIQRQEPYVKYEREFFGPEITLARRLFHAGIGPLAIVKVGFFGTSLAEDWHPNASEGNRLYAILQDKVAHAIRQLGEAQPFHLAGFFWMQGESDAAQPASAAAYEANLRVFITSLRDNLAIPELPFVLGRIGPPPPRNYPYQGEVRAAQVAVASSTTSVAWVDTDDLPRDTDGIHLLAAGVMTLGTRWADAWLRLHRFPEETTGAGSHVTSTPPD